MDIYRIASEKRGSLIAQLLPVGQKSGIYIYTYKSHSLAVKRSGVKFVRENFPIFLSLDADQVPRDFPNRFSPPQT